MKTLAEKIKDAIDALVKTKDDLTVATEALQDDPENETLLAEIDELSNSAEKQQTTIAALEKAEKVLKERAKPAAGTTTTEESETTPAAPAIAKNLKIFRDPKKGGEIMWKHATARLIAHIEKKPVQQVIEERYRDDERVKATYDYNQIVAKSAVDPAMTTVPAWAGALVREDTRGFIETLVDTSVVASLAPFVQSFDFAGANSIRIPYENPLADVPTEPAWVGEGGVIPLTSFTFGALILNPYKLAAISTMTREIIDRSTPAIEGIVQNLLRKAYAKVLDQAFLDETAAAVANVRPASPWNGVAALPAAAGTPDENIRADILTLLTALTEARLGQRPVLIGNNLNFLTAGMMVNAMGDFLYRGDLNAGNLLGIPVVSSGAVALDQLRMVDANYIALALGGIEFDVSDVATVTEANADATPPTQATGAAGAVGTEGQVPVQGGIPVAGGSGAAMAGVKARSLWQTYSIGIRMVSHVSWGKTNPAAAQWIDGIDWGG